MFERIVVAIDGSREGGKTVPIASIRAADIPRRFGFVARPAPRAGEPEC